MYGEWCVGPQNCSYNTSPSGWMEAQQFEEWFESTFLKHVKNIEGNKLLILDGYLSHITLEVVEKARNNNVRIIKLPPHSTNYLQPMGVGVKMPFL